MGEGLDKDQEVGVLAEARVFERATLSSPPTPCPGSWPKAGLNYFFLLFLAKATEGSSPSLFVLILLFS